MLQNLTVKFPDVHGNLRSRAELSSDCYQLSGFKFFPLFSKSRGVGVALDILFLSRDQRGQLVSSGGDIDNRIKVLFDGLRVPKYDSELKNLAPEEGENPLFCLLEDDDSLITSIKITTDRLLTPIADEEAIHDVHLIVHVEGKLEEVNSVFSRS
jgi:hypothetical protein